MKILQQLSLATIPYQRQAKIITKEGRYDLHLSTSSCMAILTLTHLHFSSQQPLPPQRGRNFKLLKPFSSILCQGNCVTVRAVCDWNILPQNKLQSEH